MQIGRAREAAKEAKEANPVKTRRIPHKLKAVNVAFQDIKKKTPAVVATPFPPLNFK